MAGPEPCTGVGGETGTVGAGGGTIGADSPDLEEAPRAEDFGAGEVLYGENGELLALAGKAVPPGLVDVDESLALFFVSGTLARVRERPETCVAVSMRRAQALGEQQASSQQIERKSSEVSNFWKRFVLHNFYTLVSSRP